MSEIDFNKLAKDAIENTLRYRPKPKKIPKEMPKTNQVKQETKKKANDGQIAPRPIYPNNLDLSNIVFKLANQHVSNIFCLPLPRPRIIDILNNSQYTYLDAIIASTINTALEGDVAASRLILSLIQDRNQ